MHDHGFVRLEDWMGDDSSIVRFARVSYGSGTKSIREDRGLIRYLMRNRHTSPFESCEVVFHLKLPIFVMRQLIRHRTANVNEYSARYSVLSEEFYTPPSFHLKRQSTKNKQGRGNDSVDRPNDVQHHMEHVYDLSLQTYKYLLESDLSRELARLVMPVAGYTECYWKIDLHNLFHFLKLRMDPHAQTEIREYAAAIHNLAEPLFPVAFEAFHDYVLNSRTFSAMELNVVADMIKGEFTSKSEDYGMSKREMTDLIEFLSKRSLV